MTKCWQYDPADRPTFKDLKDEERAGKTDFHRESNSGSVTGNPVHQPLSHDSQLKISLPTLSHIPPGGTPILESRT